MTTPVELYDCATTLYFEALTERFGFPLPFLEKEYCIPTGFDNFDSMDTRLHWRWLALLANIVIWAASIVVAVGAALWAVRKT